MVHLSRETPTGEAENHEHQRDRREDGRDAADPPLKPADRRRQHEREQDRERDRHEHGLRPIEDDNDQHTTGERHPRFHRLRRVIHGGPRLNCMAQAHLGLFTLEHCAGRSLR